MSFKICSIGCGWHATENHGPSYRKYSGMHPDVLLAACCDIDEEKARFFQKTFGFNKYYTDIDRMLEIEKPDAVCLTAPVHLTAFLAGEILEKGFPLILEKPPGTTKEEVMRLVEISHRNNVPNRVAFNRRYAPLSRRLKGILTDCFKPEDIHNIQCEMFRAGRLDEDFSTTAIHVIDFVRYLAGSDYSHIRFHYQELPHLSQGVCNIYMDCTFKTGASAFFNISPVSGVCIERCIVNLQGNTFFLNAPMWSDYDDPGRLIHVQDNIVNFDVTGNDISDGVDIFEYTGVYHENASFFDGIRAGRKPEGDLESAVQSVVVAECIRNRVLEYKL